MAIFEIEHGGKVFEVDAPDQGAALSAFQQFSGTAPAASVAGAIEGQSGRVEPSLMGSIANNPLLSPITDIPQEIGGAAKSALGSITENLNPFSDKHRASIEKRSKQPFFSLEALKEHVSSLGDVGSGLGAIPALAASPITGAARSLIGHPYAAITGMPYEEAKDKVDTAMMGVRALSVGPGAKPRTLPAKTPSTAEIDAAATAGFDSAKNSGVLVPAADVKNLAQTVKTDLTADGFRDYLAPKTFAVLSELENAPAGGASNIADLHGVRRVLGKAASSPDPTERAAASRVMATLDKQLSAISPELKDAIGNYATLKKAEELGGKMDNAANNAGAANSGMNVENSIRQQLRSILNSPKARRGYKPEELEQMRKIARGTMTADAIRTAGNLLGGGLGMHGAIMAGAGFMAAPPFGALAPVAGAGMKMLGNKLAKNKASALDEMIRARSPLAQSMPPRQMLPPHPLLGSIFPYGFPQGLIPLMGAMPARAEDE